MAADHRADLRQMKLRIEQVEKAARELRELGGGVPVVEKNTRTILSATNLLQFGISDVAEIETQSRSTAMEEVKKIRTVCRSCHGGCGVIAHVQNGKVIKVEGRSGFSHQPWNPLQQRAGHHPVGLPSRSRPASHEEAADGWQRTTWDEALIHDRREVQSGHRELTDPSRSWSAKVPAEITRATCTVSPTVGDAQCSDRRPYVLCLARGVDPGHLRESADLRLCRRAQNALSCGAATRSGPTRTNTRESSFWTAYKKGAKLICIDPRKGFVAKRADLWLQLRAGNGRRSGHGLPRVIMEEELYDREFAAGHIHGWEAFRERG